MWRLLIVVIGLALSGCSYVTVEPADEGENDAQIEPVEEPAKEDANTQPKKKLKEKISDFLGLNQTDDKAAGARELHYIALGDSLTRGVGDEKMEYGYTIRLSQELEKWPQITGVQLDNRGKNGRRSDQLLTLLEKGHYDKELAQADLITMTLGGNDVMKVVKNDVFRLKKEMFDEALPGFKTRYEQIVQQIRARNAQAPLILIGFYNPFHIVTDETTPFEMIINEWNTEIQTIAKTDVNACFVPVADLFVTNTNLVYHTDFFHPNGKGYDQMAERIKTSMRACNIEAMSGGRIGFEE